MNKLQGCYVQHGELRYIVITLYGVQSIDLLNHYVVHLKLM